MVHLYVNSLSFDMPMPCLFNRDDLETQVQLDHKALQVTQDKMVTMVVQDSKEILVHRYTIVH